MRKDHVGARSSSLLILLLVFIALPKNIDSFTTIASSRIRLYSSALRLSSSSSSSPPWRDDEDDEGDRPGDRQRRLQDNIAPRKKSGRFAQSAHFARPTTTTPSKPTTTTPSSASTTSAFRSNNINPPPPFRSSKFDSPPSRSRDVDSRPSTRSRDLEPAKPRRSRDSEPPFSRSRDVEEPKRQSSKPIFASSSSSKATFSSSSRSDSVKSSSTPTSPSSSSSPPPPSSSDFMWKSGKSIDDLERIMKQRWGTKADRWMANPQDFEDDDNDDPDNVAVVKPKGNPAVAAFSRRGKPVMDPWQPAPPPRQEFDDDDDDFDEDDEDVEIIEDDDDDDEEFYDEDDEGYEPSKSKNSDWDLNHMIQPQPAGGKGTKSLMKSSSSSSSAAASLPKPFFFPRQEPSVVDSNPRNVNNNDNNKHGRTAVAGDRSNVQLQDEEIKPKSRPKPTVPDLDPVMDDGGSPIFLTLEQAEREFAAISATSTSEEVEEEDSDADSTASTSLSSSSTPSSWQELGITSQILLDNLNSMGCPTPLAVQLKSCPAILLGGQDVVVGTYTGSGKTLAVLVPLVQRLLWQQEELLSPHEEDDEEDYDDEEEEEEEVLSVGSNEGYVIEDDDAPPLETTKKPRSAPVVKKSGSSSGVHILIVVPGRELASQMVTVARSLVEGTHLVPMLAIGGTTLARNWENMRKRKPHIIIGTPGRLAELILGPPGEKNGKLKVGALQSVVLDEFDALLDYKAHRDPTQGLLEFLKKRHRQALQCVFCSATAGDMINSPKVKNFLRPGFVQAMTDRDDVLVTPQTKSLVATRTSRTIIHGVVHVPHRRFALETLRKILHTDPLPQQILIFAENARRVDIVVEKLDEMGIVAAPLHGGMGSEKVDRAEVSKALREGYVGIVVATELAARGLDAPLLTHVINLELPTDASHYAHRAGRCGRGGRPGVVINFTTNAQEKNVPQRFAEELGVVMHTVEPRNGKLNIVHAPAPSQPVTL